MSKVSEASNGKASFASSTPSLSSSPSALFPTPSPSVSTDSSESVEKASLEETDYNYLYEDEQNYFFINPKTFEQIEIKKNLIGEKGKLLTENLIVTVSFYNENPILIDLPNQVICKIESTDAALKGQTISSSYKPAILNNGLNIQVPPFIEAGDDIIVDTRNLEYIKKV